jgi:hypothetical protein
MRPSIIPKVLICLFSGTLATPVFASDYMHLCRSADGAYEMNDEALAETADETKKDIPYRTLKDTVLSRKEGYCLAGGKKYGFEAKNYVRRIRLTGQGQPMEFDMICELASDGLPAAASCEKEVVTLDTTASGKAAKPPSSPQAVNPSASALWSHNGSVMRLETDGARRFFVYESPRPGLIKAGAKRGDVVFDGKREGDIYTGQAFIFSKRCGPQGYPVNGYVSDDERSVTLEGLAPILGDDCSLKSGKPDVLRFDYVAR